MRIPRSFYQAAGAAAVLVLPATATAQEITLLATGEVEWSVAGYHPPAAFMHKPGDYRGEFPYLNIEANRDSIRGRIGREVVDNPNAHHLRSLQHGLKFSSQEEEFRHPFQRTRELLSSADVAVGLLAMPLSDRARPRRTGVLGVPAFAHALKWAGYDMISVANNRLLDAETIGLLDTGPALERAGLAWGGAGRNLEEARRPVIIERKGVKLAFLSSTYGVFGFGVDGFALPDAAGVMAMDRFLIREDIKRIRDQVDFVVLNLHWGVTQNQESHEEERKFAREMIDAGANVIFGHHSHQPTGIEVYKGAVIIYSLANFAFNHSHEFFKDNYVARLTLSKGGAIPKVEILPMAGRHQDRDIFQPYLLQGERAQELLRDIQKRSAKFNTEMAIDGDVGLIRPKVTASNP
jgi:hypothetical protein